MPTYYGLLDYSYASTVGSGTTVSPFGADQLVALLNGSSSGLVDGDIIKLRGIYYSHPDLGTGPSIYNEDLGVTLDAWNLELYGPWMIESVLSTIINLPKCDFKNGIILRGNDKSSTDGGFTTVRNLYNVFFVGYSSCASLTINGSECFGSTLISFKGISLGLDDNVYFRDSFIISNTNMYADSPSTYAHLSSCVTNIEDGTGPGQFFENVGEGTVVGSQLGWVSPAEEDLTYSGKYPYALGDGTPREMSVILQYKSFFQHPQDVRSFEANYTVDPVVPEGSGSYVGYELDLSGEIRQKKSVGPYNISGIGAWMTQDYSPPTPGTLDSAVIVKSNQGLNKYWRLRVSHTGYIFFETETESFRSLERIVQINKWSFIHVDFVKGNSPRALRMFFGDVGRSYKEIAMVLLPAQSPESSIYNRLNVVPNSSLKIDELQIWGKVIDNKEYFNSLLNKARSLP